MAFEGPVLQTFKCFVSKKLCGFNGTLLPSESLLFQRDLGKIDRFSAFAAATTR